MPEIRSTPQYYLVDEQPAYLLSGEMHYFRTPRKDWLTRMQLLKDAGGNCVATYVPWLLHEPEEGRFVFGEGGWRLDLEGFLEAAQSVGLAVIARPGPYQYSELVHMGLPGWLFERYPETLARSATGETIHASSVSYLHPTFLDKTAAWFERVCPLLARYTTSRGGPIALVQLDNESGGVHLWYGGPDYHPEAMGVGREGGRWPEYLRKRYGSTARLREAYGTAFEAFGLVPGAPPRALGEPHATRWKRDYFQFYCSAIAEYFEILAAMAREYGIDTPLVHNAPNPSMNGWFLETVERFGEGMLLGSDHYYSLDQRWPQNNPTPQYAVRCFVSMEMLSRLGYPPTVLELPGGSKADWPPVTPRDAETCYLLNLAFGMKGSNYYMFTGGANPENAGETGDLYDYGAGIGADGEVRPLYHAQHAFGGLIAENPWLCEAEGMYDFRAAVDLEAARASYYEDSKQAREASQRSVWEFLQTGVFTSALCAGLSPTLCDARANDWADDTSTPVYLLSGYVMPESIQRRAAAFLARGGRLLLGPEMPVLNEQYEPCSVLADYVGMRSEALAVDPARVTVLGYRNLWANISLYQAAVAPDAAEEWGVEERSGRPIAWGMATPGGGRFAYLGLHWYHAVEGHANMLRAVLERLGLERSIASTNPCVWVVARRAGTRTMVFAMNLFTSPQKTTISLCAPNDEAPVHLGEVEIPAMSVRTWSLDGAQVVADEATAAANG